MGCGSSTTAKADHGRLCLPQNMSKEDQEKRKEEVAEIKKKFKMAVNPGLPNWVESVPAVEVTVKGVWELTKVFYRLQVSKIDAWTDHAAAKIDGDPEFKQPFGRFYALFDEDSPDQFKDVPAVASVWKTDEEFAYQHLNGLVPQFLKKVKGSIPDNFKVTDDDVSLPEGTTLEKLLAEGKLYMSDVCDSLEGVQTINDNIMTVPMTLYVVDDMANKLLPLAIALDRNGGRVYSRKKDGDNVWLAAKISCMCGEFQIHTLLVHALTQHLMMEPFWCSLSQCLSPQHPLHQLMEPHMWNMVYVNAGVRDSLMEKENASGTSGALQANLQAGLNSAEILKREYAKIEWGEYFNIPKRYAEADVKDIPNFRFLKEILLLWDEIEKYVKEFMNAVYPKPEDLKEDYEVQAWAKAMGDPNIGDMRGLPGSLKNGVVDSIDDLALLCTMVIFQCGVRHSHVENSAVYYYPWIPLLPGSCKIPNPIPDDIDEMAIDGYLPNMTRTISQIALIDSVNVPEGTVESIAQFGKDYFEGAPDGCEEANRKFVARMHEIDAEMKKEYEALKGTNPVAHPFLAPSTLSQSIWN